MNLIIPIDEVIDEELVISFSEDIVNENQKDCERMKLNPMEFEKLKNNSGDNFFKDIDTYFEVFKGLMLDVNHLGLISCIISNEILYNIDKIVKYRINQVVLVTSKVTLKKCEQYFICGIDEYLMDILRTRYSNRRFNPKGFEFLKEIRNNLISKKYYEYHKYFKNNPRDTDIKLKHINETNSEKYSRPLADLKLLSENEKALIKNLTFKMLNQDKKYNSKNDFNILKNVENYYFIEHLPFLSEPFLRSIKELKGLSLLDDEVYERDYFKIFYKLPKINCEPIPDNCNFTPVNFIQALDNKLADKINNALKSNDYRCLYLLTTDGYLIRKVREIIKYQLEPVSKEKLVKTKPINKYLLIRNFTELIESRQVELWNHFETNQFKTDGFVLFIDSKSPDRQINYLPIENIWEYDKSYFERNASKIFYSLLSESKIIQFNSKTLFKIENNWYKELAWIENCNWSVYADAIDIIKNWDTPFDFDSPKCWYHYKQIYDTLLANESKPRTVESTPHEKRTVKFVLLENRNWDIEGIPLKNEKIPSTQSLITLILILHYHELHKMKEGYVGIKNTYLLELLEKFSDLYPPRKERDKRGNTESAPSAIIYNKLKGAKIFYKEPKLHDFIKDHISKTPGTKIIDDKGIDFQFEIDLLSQQTDDEEIKRLTEINKRLNSI
ncbi:MAG: hypothetical protein V1720_03605 [bacterium]